MATFKITAYDGANSTVVWREFTVEATDQQGAFNAALAFAEAEGETIAKRFKSLEWLYAVTCQEVATPTRKPVVSYPARHIGTHLDVAPHLRKQAVKNLETLAGRVMWP